MIKYYQVKGKSSNQVSEYLGKISDWELGTQIRAHIGYQGIYLRVQTGGTGLPT